MIIFIFKYNFFKTLILQKYKKKIKINYFLSFFALYISFIDKLKFFKYKEQIGVFPTCSSDILAVFLVKKHN